MKNKTINILKMIVCSAGFILTAMLDMNLIAFVITLSIYSGLQAWQLKINGVPSEISGPFLRYFNVAVSFVVLFFIFYILFIH